VPLLSRSRLTAVSAESAASFSARAPAAPDRASRLLASCANLQCDSGWLHLWRSRSGPFFEDGWSCSPECTEILVEAAVGRELDGRVAGEEAHRHRVPLGLVMLEQGWITAPQLRHALDAQRRAGAGRLGQWLVRREGVSEQLVTRALGLQWSCPVLALEFHDAEALTALVPRLFLDAFAALPLRLAAGKVLYLGFADRLDLVLAHALERMTGLRVECGLVRESLFRPAHERMLAARFPSLELMEAASAPVAAQAFSRAVERFRPAASRLVRVHNFLWLRLWRRAAAGSSGAHPGIQDLICTVGAH
jgi:hypothetical protein